MQTEFVVIGSENCGWCKRAVALLEEKALTYSYHNIASKRDPVLLLMRQLNLKTVPQIFALTPTGQEHIPGFEALEEYLISF